MNECVSGRVDTQGLELRRDKQQTYWLGLPGEDHGAYKEPVAKD